MEESFPPCQRRELFLVRVEFRELRRIEPFARYALRRVLALVCIVKILSLLLKPLVANYREYLRSL